VFLSAPEFDQIAHGISLHHSCHLVRTRLELNEKILMGLLFVFQYYANKTLSLLFRCSEGYVSECLAEILPAMASFCSSAIPNALDSTTPCSRLNQHIVGVLDNTLHRTTRPSIRQSLQFNGHYQMHGRLSQFMVDFEGKIISFVTNIPGKIHDNLSARFNSSFADILMGKFLIGDSAFNGVPYVVPGFKPSQLGNDPKRIIFDGISREEQRVVERVNKFVKDARSVNKQDVFRHSEEKLVACVFIATGLYNFKRSWGCYSSADGSFF